MNCALLFQGQGSYHTAYIKQLIRTNPKLIKHLQLAEKILGWSLIQIIENNDDLGILPTNLAQPAIYTSEYISYIAFKDCLASSPPDYISGHSLGEITALTIAEALSFETGLRLVATRGELMQQSYISIPQGMLVLYKCTKDSVESLCQEAFIQTGYEVYCANFNSSSCIIVSGAREALDYISSKGTFHCHPLSVTRAFHTKYMQNAADNFLLHLQRITFNNPKIPVISNVTARPYQLASSIPELLYKQITMPVLWAEIMNYMIKRGIDLFLQVNDSHLFNSMQDDLKSETSWGSLKNLSEGTLYDFGSLYPAHLHKVPYIPDIVGEILGRMIGYAWPSNTSNNDISTGIELYNSAQKHLLSTSLTNNDLIISIKAMRDIMILKGKDKVFCDKEIQYLLERYGLTSCIQIN